MSRTALLQPAHLDHVEGRLALLAQKMNDVAERKAALLDDADKQSRLVWSVPWFLELGWVISLQVLLNDFCQIFQASLMRGFVHYHSPSFIF